VSIRDSTSRKRIIEAILFTSPSPVSIERLKKISDMGKKEVKTCLEKLSKEYEERAFSIIKVNNK